MLRKYDIFKSWTNSWKEKTFKSEDILVKWGHFFRVWAGVSLDAGIEMCYQTLEQRTAQRWLWVMNCRQCKSEPSENTSCRKHTHTTFNKNIKCFVCDSIKLHSLFFNSSSESVGIYKKINNSQLYVCNVNVNTNTNTKDKIWKNMF